MKVIHHASGAALLAHAGAFLEASEAENGLLLGICGGPSAPSGSLFVSVDDASGPVAVAVRTPPFNLAVSKASPVAMNALATDLEGRGFELPGVNGHAETARAFGERWATTHGARVEVRFRQGVYVLTRVIPPSPRASGALRFARIDDLALIRTWMNGFCDDAMLSDHERKAFAANAPGWIDGKTIFLWDDAGAPVSMGVLRAPTKHGVRVGMVYTPAERRRRGYASACVAEISARMLASGKTHCTLFTDLANATSNRVYEAIGYEMIYEAAMLEFVAT